MNINIPDDGRDYTVTIRRNPEAGTESATIKEDRAVNARILAQQCDRAMALETELETAKGLLRRVVGGELIGNTLGDINVFLCPPAPPVKEPAGESDIKPVIEFSWREMRWRARSRTSRTAHGNTPNDALAAWDAQNG